jgi:hypothetical protein
MAHVTNFFSWLFRLSGWGAKVKDKSLRFDVFLNYF